MTTRVLLSAVVCVAALLSTGSGADAQSRNRRGDDGAVVKACSIYGNGCASAPIRRGSVGLEFRLPGGTWVGCRQDCKTALREETVDFWETQRERAGDAFM